MYNVGAIIGLFSFPHKGHLNAILKASTYCEELYVVIISNDFMEEQLYKNIAIKRLTMKEKARCLSFELNGFDHIKILMIETNDVTVKNLNLEIVLKKITGLLNKDVDVIFNCELENKEIFNCHSIDSKLEVFNADYVMITIHTSNVLNNIYMNWDLVLGSLRAYYAKKVVFVGTESCGKTTLVKMLAKLFNTTYAEEAGRYYASKYMGGNENVFMLRDFYNIAIEQRQLEENALLCANKISFFDTDLVVTQLYCKLFTGEYNPDIEPLIDKYRYDMVVFLEPDTKWVADGIRFADNQSKRVKYSEQLKKLYSYYGYGERLVVISGSYNEKLSKCVEISKNLLLENNIRNVVSKFL